jgi:uncharacterized protein (DUF433 family)
MIDDRFTVPLYTVPSAASHLGMKSSRLRDWAKKDSLLTTIDAESRYPRLPFIALVEAQVYQELLGAGLSLQAIRTGMAKVREQLGPRMLARGVLAHDGRDILMNLASAGDPEWTRARDLQGGLPRVIEMGLRPVTWDEQGIPQSVQLTAYHDADVIADPRIAFGQPVINRTRVRVEDLLSLFKAGESIDVVAEEMDIPPSSVESIVRSRNRVSTEATRR